MVYRKALLGPSCVAWDEGCREGWSGGFVLLVHNSLGPTLQQRVDGNLRFL